MKNEKIEIRLENQVCSLELSKKLKELGVKQDSIFYWIVDSHDRKEISYKNHDIYLLDADTFFSYQYSVTYSLCSSYFKINKKYSAFTVSEMGQMIRKKCIFLILVLLKIN